MSTTEQPPQSARLVVAVVGSIVAVMMLATAGAEAGLLRALVSRRVPAHQYQVEISLYAIGLGLLWIFCLGFEWTHRYNGRAAAFGRRSGFLAQAVILSLTTWAGWSQGGPRGGIEFALLVSVMVMFWRTWMHVNSLHPDDQRQVDQLLAERNRRRGMELEKQYERDRLERTQAVFALLNLAPGVPVEARETAVEEVAATPVPALAYRPVPTGKHEPLVYFIRNGSRIKIGTSTNVRSRVRALSLRPEDILLTLPGGADVERSYHRKFSALRIDNTEWFRVDRELVDFIIAKHPKEQ